MMKESLLLIHGMQRRDKMKEVTYEEWIKNPTPRVMWVWDTGEEIKVQRKVVYVLKAGACDYPVMVVTDECMYENYCHCAEIEKSRRMTYKELSRWLREKPTREYTYSYKEYIGNWCGYTVDNQDNEVTKDILIREDDGEWKEPLIEIE